MKRGSSPGSEEPEAKEKPATDEAADANAIEVQSKPCYIGPCTYE